MQNPAQLDGEEGIRVSWKVVCIALFALVAVVMAAPGSKAASGAEIEASVHGTLENFYQQVRGGRELAGKAFGILVFPSVVKAGIGIGGEYGEGALVVGGRVRSYYNTVAASVGFQLGVQSRSVIIMFMTQGAYNQFRGTAGWKVGVDGSVAIITVGIGGSIDTNKITSPVIGFVLDPTGLMYNLTLEGSKITQISR